MFSLYHCYGEGGPEGVLQGLLGRARWIALCYLSFPLLPPPLPPRRLQDRLIEYAHLYSLAGSLILFFFPFCALVSSQRCSDAVLSSLLGRWDHASVPGMEPRLPAYKTCASIQPFEAQRGLIG